MPTENHLPTTFEDQPLRHLARITVELQTPLHIGSGKPGEIADADIIRDVNDLPVIPGFSIAGVLRHQFEALKDVEPHEVQRVFGYQEGNTGMGSSLSVSWGHIHDKTNTPVEGYRSSFKDEVLQAAILPTLRDHVRINHQGVSDAEQHGKFDELAVHAGHRFSFEIELVSHSKDDEAWFALLRLLQSPAFRLGGKTRRGFGCVKTVSIKARTFDLSQQADFNAYAKHSPKLSDPPDQLHEWQDTSCSEEVKPFALLELSPRAFWMFGGGVDEQIERENENWAAADAAPVRDKRIIWAGESSGKVEENVIYLPGSSIKGALAHRTVFHHNRLLKRYARNSKQRESNEHKQAQDICEPRTGENNEAVQALFGYAKDNKDTQSGQAGHVYIPDIYLSSDGEDANRPDQMKLQHVSIDRFTGGALDTALYDERPLHGGGILTIPIYTDLIDHSDEDSIALQSLQFAVKDLAEGRLPLGAGSGRGHGFMEGNLTLFNSSEPTD